MGIKSALDETFLGHNSKEKEAQSSFLSSKYIEKKVAIVIYELVDDHILNLKSNH